MCRLYNKILNTTSDFEFKQFLFDYKKLKKQVKLSEMKEARKENRPVSHRKQEIPITVVNNVDLLSLTRTKRQEAIKKVLKDAISLKMQLKSQLKALREREIIDKEIIDSNIRLTNLNINEI